jgi:hypothetical protein
MFVDRNASDMQKQEYKRHFKNLQIFLQFYKEKLMLTKKVQDSLGKHVVTVDALKKAKDGYTDQFQLDFEQLFKVFLAEQDRKAKGHRIYVPESKPKREKRNIAKEKRERMVSYGRKVAGYTPINFNLSKPDNSRPDYNDIENRACKEISEYGKLAAYQQNIIQTKAKGLKEYLDTAFKKTKHSKTVNKWEYRA